MALSSVLFTLIKLVSNFICIPVDNWLFTRYNMK